MATEDTVRVVQNTAQATDKQVRNLAVTVNVAGTPAMVDMQVVVLSDADGNLLTDPASNQSVQQAAQAIAAAIAQAVTYCDTNNVQVAGGTICIKALPPVQATLIGATVPIPVAPSLPPNAALETAGNLDRLSASAADEQAMMAQQTGLLAAILGQMNELARARGVPLVTYP